MKHPKDFQSCEEYNREGCPRTCHYAIKMIEEERKFKSKLENEEKMKWQHIRSGINIVYQELLKARSIINNG